MNDVRRAIRATLMFVALFVPVSASSAPSALKEPQRVASLNLAADEVLAEILPPTRLVAVTRFADDPGNSNVAGRLPATAVRLKADIERLVALRPDLVIVSAYHEADFLDLLRRSGLRVYRLQGLDTLDGIRRGILGLGEAVGETEGARRLVERFDARLAEVQRRLQGAPRPRVLYWSDPHTAGTDTSYGALIECGGGSNVARELGLSGITPIGAERAFITDPDVVLLGAIPGEGAALRAHPLLSQLRAVRQGRVIEMPTRLLVALSHHAATSCEFLATALHPDRFPPRR